MSGRVLVVVSSPDDLPEIPADRLLTADRYLAGVEGLARGATVVNLCRSYRYRSKGYYVSLIADARGQQILPSAEGIEGLSEPFGVLRVLHEAGVPTVEASEALTRRRGPGPGSTKGNGAMDGGGGRGEVELLAYFGVCGDARGRTAAQAIYREWPTPVLRLTLVEDGEEWLVSRVSAVPLPQLDDAERPPLVEALTDERRVHRRSAPMPRELKRASIAVLYDPDDPFSPSTPETIERIEKVAARLKVHAHRIGLDELDRLGEYDALLIRTLTGVREPSFQFALRAEMLDMPVVDDPQSIIRCSNKVFLEELLRREDIATPRTLVVTSRTDWRDVEALGLPVVVKLPDGSFSAAVHKCATRHEYERITAEMFRRSPLLIAQEYLPTDFDWRITVLGGRVLFVARYFMARGHWQIRSAQEGHERFGKVEAVRRADAPRAVSELALRAASLIGNGLYGVDIKETPRGPVVIEINDNPNLDIGYDDAADGVMIYEDIIGFFLRRIEETPGAAPPSLPAPESPAMLPARAPATRTEARRHFRPFEVAGLEIEYAVVDRDLNVVSMVAPALRALAGRPTSDVDLGTVGFSNEIADHVFELKTPQPTRSLRDAEQRLVEGVQRFSAVLRDGFGARLLPTGMHPWLDPRKARIWSRSNARIYGTYARLFDVQTHGWMNVQSTHLNLPMGRSEEAVAMMNAAALVIPYLPALAASSPMYEGELQDAVDNRLAWILKHQARIPESQGWIVPEFTSSLADYRRNVLGPMYQALDALPEAGALRHEFFNARGAVFKFSRRALEVRVLDTQECVRMDVAVAVFVRAVLRAVTKAVRAGRVELPPHALLVDDFRATIAAGSEARVWASHLVDTDMRDDEGRVEVRQVLRGLLERARREARKDEAEYLDLAERIIDTGSLSERIRAALLPYTGEDEVFTETARRVYIELADCLDANEPWRGRGL